MTDQPSPHGSKEGWLELIYRWLRDNLLVGTKSAITVEQVTYSTVKSGEVSGSATAKQLPQLACKLVAIVAVASNAGNVYVGGAGVTKVDGTTDATTGYELDASMQTPWLPVADLNELYVICDNAGDDITYIALR